MQLILWTFHCTLCFNESQGYEYIIDLGRQLPPLSPELQIEKYKIQGCQAQVWIVPRFEKGYLFFALLFFCDVVNLMRLSFGN